MKRRTVLFAVPAILALGAAGYAAFWWIASDRIADGLDLWAEERRRDGWTVSYDPPRADGFPAWIAFEIGRPVIEAPVRDGTAQWKGATLRLRARPWQWQRIEFTSPGKHRARHLHLPSRRTLHARAQDAAGSVFLGAGGQPGEISVKLSSVGIRPGGGSSVGSADGSGDIRIDRIDTTVTAAIGGETPQSVKAELNMITLPPNLRPPLGRKIERIDLSAILSRPVPAGPLAPSLAAWRDAGGGLKLRDLAVVWGPLRVFGEGQFVLDAALQPRGRMTVQAQGYNETIDAFARAGRVKRRELMGVRIVLGLLARPAPNGGPPQITLPLTILDRIVTAGPQRLGRLPRIVWD